MENELIRRGDAYKLFCNWCAVCPENKRNPLDCEIIPHTVHDIPAVDAVEVETVCEMMEFLFGDSCPCNCNGIDEWLPYVCEDQEECPDPAIKYGCWKQFIKHFGKRREDGKDG